MNILHEDLDHILEHTKALWEDLRERKVFVTGGIGFFGKWLLESFVWANNQLDLNAQMHVLSRLGWTQEKIAEKVGLSRNRTSEIIGNTSFGNIDNLLSQSRDMKYITGGGVVPDVCLLFEGV